MYKLRLFRNNLYICCHFYEQNTVKHAYSVVFLFIHNIGGISAWSLEYLPIRFFADLPNIGADTIADADIG